MLGSAWVANFFPVFLLWRYFKPYASLCLSTFCCWSFFSWASFCPILFPSAFVFGPFLLGILCTSYLFWLHICFSFLSFSFSCSCYLECQEGGHSVTVKSHLIVVYIVFTFLQRIQNSTYFYERDGHTHYATTVNGQSKGIKMRRK